MLASLNRLLSARFKELQNARHMPKSFASGAAGSSDTHRINLALRVEKVSVGPGQPGDSSQSLAVSVLRNQVLRGGSAPRLALQFILFVGCHTTPTTSQNEFPTFGGR